MAAASTHRVLQDAVSAWLMPAVAAHILPAVWGFSLGQHAPGEPRTLASSTVRLLTPNWHHVFCRRWTVVRRRPQYDSREECNVALCDEEGPNDPSCCDAMSFDMYLRFFLACMILVLLLECGGGFYLVSRSTVSCRNVLLVLVVGVRSFDMMSDWYVTAGRAIVLRRPNQNKSMLPVPPPFVPSFSRDNT